MNSPELILQIVKVSIAITAGYFFYIVFLRRLTFYRANRFFLLAWILLSVPMATLTYSTAELLPSHNTIELKDFVINLPEITMASSPAWAVNVMLAVIFAGIAVRLVWLMVGVIAWLRLQSQAVFIEKNGGVGIYALKGEGTSFTFFNNVYIDSSLLGNQELPYVIAHETVHARDFHSFDIILSELFLAINWYNPFAWLLRNAVRENLEFIADNDAILQTGDKTGYQLALVRRANAGKLPLSAEFSMSPLKRRFVMINAASSNRFQKFKFALLLPFIALLSFAFSTYSPTDVSFEKRPGKFIMVKTGSDRNQVEKLKDVLRQANFEISGEKQLYSGDALVAWSGVLSGEPFADQLTKRFSFAVNSSQNSSIGYDPETKRLWYSATTTSTTNSSNE
jgi:hypothetical protein